VPRDLVAHRVERLDQRRDGPVVVAARLALVGDLLQGEDRFGVLGRGVDD
jgi:hypothetical protein